MIRVNFDSCNRMYRIVTFSSMKEAISLSDVAAYYRNYIWNKHSIDYLLVL